MDKAFTLTWRDGRYYVSRPDIGTMDVIPVSEVMAVVEANGRMREALEEILATANVVTVPLDHRLYEIALIARRAIALRTP